MEPPIHTYYLDGRHRIKLVLQDFFLELEVHHIHSTAKLHPFQNIRHTKNMVVNYETHFLDAYQSAMRCMC